MSWLLIILVMASMLFTNIPTMPVRGTHCSLDYTHDVSITITAPTKAIHYKAPGTQNISGTAKNNGTSPETGLVATAAFNNSAHEYYNNSISGITLAAGDQQELSFPNFTFMCEDVYTLRMSLPLATDEDPTNNAQSITLGIDATPPVVQIIVDPPNPNGQNGWYITNPSISFNVYDPPLNGTSVPGSGIASIMFKIDDGCWMTYTGPFVITADGTHSITVMAIDRVGNIGMSEILSYKVDTHNPTITLSKKIGFNSITFTANVSDFGSGVERVVFSTDYEQVTIYEPGPYIWRLSPIPGPNGTNVKAQVFDYAGRSSIVFSGSITPQAAPQPQQCQSTLLCWANARGRPQLILGRYHISGRNIITLS